MDDFSAVGKKYVENCIIEMEGSMPGWVPMFYITGSYKGDIDQASSLRAKFNIPRPQEVQDRINKALADYELRAKQASDSKALHESRMRTEWLYWLKNKFRRSRYD